MASNKKLSVSVALGTLLIPLSAFAASVLVKDAPPVETTTSVAAQVVAEATTDFANQTATAADLQAACGVEGLQLVAAEANSSMSAIQQAALDALREVCAQEGLPLPGKPTPEPVTQTVVVASSASSPSVSQGSSYSESESEHEQDEHEEHEHEEEDDD
jgi:hypothetical protein